MHVQPNSQFKGFLERIKSVNNPHEFYILFIILPFLADFHDKSKTSEAFISYERTPKHAS